MNGRSLLQSESGGCSAGLNTQAFSPTSPTIEIVGGYTRCGRSTLRTRCLGLTWFNGFLNASRVIQL
jgi:hypothetical protein